MSSLAEMATILLAPKDRAAVLGDLAEMGASGWSALGSVLGFLVRQQLELWRAWQPWIASSVVFAGSLLLLGVSYGLSVDSRHLLRGERGYGSVLCEALLMLSWAWTSGFVVGSLSGKTRWVSGVLCAIPCLSCVLRFKDTSLSRLCVLLFLLPGVVGAAQGVRRARLSHWTALTLAIAMTALMLVWGTMYMRNWFLFLPAWWLVAHAERSELSNRKGGGMKTQKKQFVTVLCALLLSAVSAVAQSGGSKSQIVERVIHSKNFDGNKIEVSADRKLVVYLPAGYNGASKRYPVLYFFPSPINGYRTLFDKSGAQALFDRGIARGTVHSFILVSVDMTTPLGASWFVNSPVTGNWEDFVVQELVPYVDVSFRTMPTRDARGLVGHHMGAYGAIRIGMKHTDVFGSIYGMNPVGTGSGVQIMDSRPNWDLLAHAASLDEVRKDGFSAIFTSIFQAHLPNPEKPPLYVDLPAHQEGGKLVIDAKLTARLRDSFFLESMIPQYADNLKTLRGLKFDWSRNDAIWDHVYSNQALTHKLNEFGIVHEAEEYNGLWDADPYWGAEGRVIADVLPFFQQHWEF